MHPFPPPGPKLARHLAPWLLSAALLLSPAPVQADHDGT